METNQLKLPNIHHAKDSNFKSSNGLSKSLDSLKSLETIADTETFYNNVSSIQSKMDKNQNFELELHEIKTELIKVIVNTLMNNK